ncbi:hypothetical protein DFS34DRAFT_596446 [Phlyctochytrium arcticum]|nr:hypothetical protein DFS34DRAFT_596446 [Phlyctochytrium arcticum]
MSPPSSLLSPSLSPSPAPTPKRPQDRRREHQYESHIRLATSVYEQLFHRHISGSTPPAPIHVLSLHRFLEHLFVNAGRSPACILLALQYLTAFAYTQSSHHNHNAHPIAPQVSSSNLHIVTKHRPSPSSSHSIPTPETPYAPATKCEVPSPQSPRDSQSELSQQPNPSTDKYKHHSLSPLILTTSALALADAFLNDTPLSLNHYQSITGLTVPILAATKRMICEALQWRLAVPRNVFVRWADLLRIAQRQCRLSSPSMKTSRSKPYARKAICPPLSTTNII